MSRKAKVGVEAGSYHEECRISGGNETERDEASRNLERSIETDESEEDQSNDQETSGRRSKSKVVGVYLSVSD